MASLVQRFKEASTWRGIIAVLTAVGVSLNPDEVAAIVSAGMALAGLVGVFTSDGKKNA